MIRDLTVLSMMILAPQQVRAEDWPNFRGPRYDGISSESIDATRIPDSGPKILWRKSIGLGMSGVTIQNGRLYTIGNEDNVDTVFCLDVNSGKTNWKHAYPCATDPNEFDGGPTSTPTVDDSIGAVFTLSRSGDLICFDGQSGDVRWSRNISQFADVRIPAWGFAGSPLVIGERLLLNVGDAGVAVDKRTGELLWASGDKDAGYSSMVPFELGDRKAVVFGSARSYVCIDPVDGTEHWRQRWLTTFGCNAADPIVDGDRVFISSGYNRGAALLTLQNDKDPVVSWKSKEMQNQMSTSVLIDDYLYGIHGDVDAGASLRCIDSNDGSVRWTSEGINFGALSATQNTLVTLSADGDLILVDVSSDTFHITGRYPLLSGRCWTAPVVSDGFLYCRSADGEVVCAVLNENLQVE